jgi:hypothetical protein
VIDGHDQPAAGRQNAPQLGQRRRPVFQVVQDQGRHDVVESIVGEGQRALQVGLLQARVVA